MSAFAMFSLKDPSLLAFDHRRHNPKDNFRTIYGINRVPCDSQMRDILDPLDPANLGPFARSPWPATRPVLERFVYLDGHYLLSLDGTTYFPPPRSIVPPVWKSTIATAASPIPINCSGPPWSIPTSRKSSRWHPSRSSSRTVKPRTTASGTPPAAGSNGFARSIPTCRSSSSKTPSGPTPHLRDLREAGAHYIIGVKPGDHAFLFDHLRTLHEAGQMQVLTLEDPATGVVHHFRFCNGVPLNESNPDESVNVLEYWRSTPMERCSISVGSPTFS